MELERLLIQYLLLIRENIDKEIRNITVNNDTIVFYYGQRGKISNTYNMIVNGQMQGIKISHLVRVEETTYYYSEEDEYTTFGIFNEIERKEVKDKGVFVYLPLTQFVDKIREIHGFESISGNHVKEVIKTLNVKEELKKLEEEKEEERKEREEKRLLNKEYIMFLYRGQPLWSLIKGTNVTNYETTLEKVKDYMGNSITEMQIGRISIKEFDIKEAKVFIIDDKILGRMIIFREDDEWFMKFIKYILNEIDKTVKEGYGVYKGFGDYERKEVNDNKIIYYYKTNKGNGSIKIGITFSTKYEQGLREIVVLVNGNKIEIPLTEVSWFIDAFIYYSMFRCIENN